MMKIAPEVFMWLHIRRFFGKKMLQSEQEDVEIETSSPQAPDNTSISSGS